MIHPLLRPYIKLTEFLGYALGPDYEISLHDLTDKNHSIIAIANNHISGRELGAPLTNFALQILKNQTYKTQDYCAHYSGLSASGKKLRSSTMFIKHNGELLGLFCINFDDSRYLELSENILRLCHPDAFVDTMFHFGEIQKTPNTLTSTVENYPNSADTLAREAVERALERLNVTADRLTSEERLQIIQSLEADGYFLIKGAVKDIAETLQCSQASVYRYLSQIKKEAHQKS